jgi:hypothetical protein
MISDALGKLMEINWMRGRPSRKADGTFFVTWTQFVGTFQVQPVGSRVAAEPE